MKYIIPRNKIVIQNLDEARSFFSSEEKDKHDRLIKDYMSLIKVNSIESQALIQRALKDGIALAHMFYEDETR